MTNKQVKDYFKNDLAMKPRHCTKSLAKAITSVAKELKLDELELMWLLLENIPINAIHTHSYGFHTARGREIINQLQDKYYEYESAS